MLRILVVLIAVFLISSNTYASFDFTKNCERAYQEALNLRLDLAREYLAKEQLDNPENDLIPLIENYIDYFYILASDDKSAFDKLKKNKSSRLSRTSAGDKSSPYHLFAQAEINLQWALLRGRYQEYMLSALEIKRAYGMLKENTRKFPDFLPNSKGLGMLNAILGSLPSGAQKALGTLGVRGSTDEGEQMLEDLVERLPASEYAVFYQESVFYLTQVWVNITKKKNAYDGVLAYTESMSDNSLLKTYLRAYTAFKTGHNDDAIAYLLKKPKGDNYVNYPYLDYLLAMAKLHKLDLSAAADFEKFLNSQKENSLVKDSYLHLAYIQLLRGNSTDYQNYLSKVKSRGSVYDEKDKQALNEANEERPNPALLKARFLFDGGYYARAKEVLNRENANNYQLLRDKIEYCYRFGRVFHETGGMAGATKFYNYTITFGKDSKYYYAANAALLLGDIYAQKKSYKKAAEYYHSAIDMKNHDYENSIENKAKEGLKRIDGKY